MKINIKFYIKNWLCYQAIGDYDGTLHLLELPYNLSKKSNEEERMISDFWNHEVERVEYYQKRFEIRA